MTAKPEQKGKWQGVMQSGRHDWITPPDLFQALNNVFHFELDPCTSSDNPLGTKYIITERMNSLDKKWQENAFVNPPFKLVKPFTAKCMQESARWKTTIVEILANRTETAAVQTYLPHAEALCLINKRVSFIDADNSQQKLSPTFGSMLMIFRPEPLTKDQLELLQSIGLVMGHYKL